MEISDSVLVGISALLILSSAAVIVITNCRRRTPPEVQIVNWS